MSKGSTPRPVDRKRFEQNWERTFAGSALAYLEPGTLVAIMGDSPVGSGVDINDVIRQLRARGKPFAGGLLGEVVVAVDPAAADDYIIYANEVERS